MRAEPGRDLGAEAGFDVLSHDLGGCGGVAGDDAFDQSRVLGRLLISFGLAVSTEFVNGIVKQVGADAFINTHAYQFAQFAHLRDLKDEPTSHNYLLMGTEGVQQHLAVFAFCQKAAAQRLVDGTWKKM